MSSIKSRYDRQAAVRKRYLDRARLCDRLTKGYLVMPESDRADETNENYQSVGSDGVSNLGGLIHSGVFPQGVPFFAIGLAPEIEHDPTIDSESKQKAKQLLFLQELTVQGFMESMPKEVSHRQGLPFRSSQRQVIDQLLVTGNGCQRIHDNYTIQTFRFDQFVTYRDTTGGLIRVIVHEEIDHRVLTPEQLKKTGYTPQQLDEFVKNDKLVSIYTQCEWQVEGKDGKWKIIQEINGNEINTSEEAVSPFIVSVFELVPGEHFGRSFVESKLGSLSSLDELEKRLGHFAALASKSLVALDYESITKPEDLASKPGSVIRARVMNGEVQDAAIFKAQAIGDFSVVSEHVKRKTEELGKSMLIQSAMVRRSERTTAYEVAQTTVRELEGAIGGFYTQLADMLQTPLLARFMWMLTRDKKLPLIPKGLEKLMSVTLLTGAAALEAQNKANALLEFVQVANLLGPEVMQRINTGVLLDLLARYKRIGEPGLILTAEEVAEIQAKRQQEAIQTQTAIDSNKALAGAGAAVVEQTLVPQ